jgi:hypothetical protein
MLPVLICHSCSVIIDRHARCSQGTFTITNQAIPNPTNMHILGKRHTGVKMSAMPSSNQLRTVNLK